jgi:hypothetical protein
MTPTALATGRHRPYSDDETSLMGRPDRRRPSVDITELDKESAELLPDRQALGCWDYGSWYGTGNMFKTNINVLNDVNILSGNLSGNTLRFVGGGW